jgi:tyrosine-protein phosphatase SIW14
MRRIAQLAFGLLIACLVIGGPFAYASRNLKQLRNFKILVPGQVYRSGVANPVMLKKTIGDYGIKSVVSLRDAREGASTDQYDAEEYTVRSMGLNYLKLSPKTWKKEGDAPPPVQTNVEQFLDLMDNPANYPVWIHCFAGTHRTGIYCALYRMEYQQWDSARAMEELKSMGYVKLDEEPDVSGYLKSYKRRH